MNTEPEETTDKPKPYKSLRGVTRKLLVAATLVAVILCGLRPYFFITGSALMLFGALLHFWSKGALVRDTEVSATGPYALARHPFYLANAIIDAGIIVISARWEIAAPYALLFCVVYFRKMRFEEKHLCALHGDTYREYMKRVPMFVPWKPPRLRNLRGFSWQNIESEGEVPRAVRIAAYPVLFFIASEAARLGWSFFEGNWWLNTVFLGVLIFAHLAAALAKREIKRRKNPRCTPKGHK
jgi:protein-S-isoprenylcysteine O-methyltransferase Ste14